MIYCPKASHNWTSGQHKYVSSWGSLAVADELIVPVGADGDAAWLGSDLARRIGRSAAQLPTKRSAARPARRWPRVVREHSIALRLRFAARGQACVDCRIRDVGPTRYCSARM